MSRLSDIFGANQSQSENPKGQVIHGNYQCNLCGGYSLEAEFFPNEQLLIWFCQSGHKNYMEKFTIQ